MVAEVHHPQNPPGYQQPADCEGFGIGCWCWVPLTLWDPGPGSVSGPPTGLVSDPGWREGGMSWRLGSLCQWLPCSSPRLSRGSASTLCSIPGVVLGLPGPLSPARNQPLSLLPAITPLCIQYYCDNKLGRWYWYPSESLCQSRQYMLPLCPAKSWGPGHCGYCRSWGIIPGGAAAGGVVASAPCESGPRHGLLVRWCTWASWSWSLKLCPKLTCIVSMADLGTYPSGGNPRSNHFRRPSKTSVSSVSRWWVGSS